MKTSCEYYHVFYYAAKYKNLTLAAGALHNSQPNEIGRASCRERVLAGV